MTLSFEHHWGTNPRYTVNEKPVRLKSGVVTSTTTFIPSYRPTDQSARRRKLGASADRQTKDLFAKTEFANLAMIMVTPLWEGLAGALLPAST
jgi:hypothetical protein